MYIKTGIFKREAQKAKKLLQEIRPEWNIEIIEEDYNLHKLGFVDDIPCSMNIDASNEEIEAFKEEIYDMETDAYIHEELLDIPSNQLSDREKAMKTDVKRAMNLYEKYSMFETFF